MSASRCFRCALEAARPVKRIHVQTRPLIQSRRYADVSTTSSSTKPSTAPGHLKQEKTEEQALQTSSNPPSTTTESPSATSDVSPFVKPTQEMMELAANESQSEADKTKPLPPNVLAAFRTPYRHPKTHGIPVASLQLRSYSVRNLEFFADFAMRVAYYLKLPASGPVPLPKRIERWTMPRSNFVHKKSQENFERITLKRMVTVYDGNPEIVEIWLAALRRWQFYGVGMKANVWHFEGLDVAAKMDKQKAEIEKELDKKLANIGWNSSVAGKKSIQEMLLRQGARVPGSSSMYIRDKIKGAGLIDLYKYDAQGKKIAES